MTLLLFFIILVLLCLILFLLIQNRTPAREQRPGDPPPSVRQSGSLREPIEFDDRPKYSKTEPALLMLRPGFTLQQVKDYFGVIPTLNGVEIEPCCQSCDVLLFRIKGLNANLIKNIVHGTVEGIPPPPPSGNPRPTGSGILGPVIYGFNYDIQHPTPSHRGNGNTPRMEAYYPEWSKENNPVLVAVLDTGLRSDVAEQFKPATASHCMGKMGYTGYNMIDGKIDTGDNFMPSGHGTPVTGMVLRSAADKVNVKILPVKVLNENGEGTLLQVMCGIAFAKNAGAKVINLSLGFYAQDPGQASFFKEFIDRMTTDNTLIIAAAGNAEYAEDIAAAQQIGEQNIRNLDRHFFYPAAFSADNRNIITVTTVRQSNLPVSQGTFTTKSLTVVETQNYSADRVQVGVESDSDNEDYFFNPFGVEENSTGESNWLTWVGSSFAAPKLAGIIAATYYDFLDEDERDGWYNRDEYMDWLCAKGFLKRKSDIQSASLQVHKQVPRYLLMRNEKEFFIPIESGLG